jgi:hypothetical protein
VVREPPRFANRKHARVAYVGTRDGGDGGGEHDRLGVAIDTLGVPSAATASCALPLYLR